MASDMDHILSPERINTFQFQYRGSFRLVTQT